MAPEISSVRANSFLTTYPGAALPIRFRLLCQTHYSPLAEVPAICEVQKRGPGRSVLKFFRLASSGKQYVGRLVTDGCSGSRADAIRSRAKLLDALPDLNDSALKQSAAEGKERMLKLAQQAERDEAETEKRRNEAFE
jgi:hypothetical protein